MWYVSCTGWQEINGWWEPAYHVKYAESRDGFDWKLTGLSCVDAGEGTAIGRPCVFRIGNRYGMLYAVRSMFDYRTKKRTYRLATQKPRRRAGNAWMVKPVSIVPRTDGTQKMIEYCWLQQHADEPICSTTATALDAQELVSRGLLRGEKRAR